MRAYTPCSLQKKLTSSTLACKSPQSLENQFGKQPYKIFHFQMAQILHCIDKYCPDCKLHSRNLKMTIKMHSIFKHNFRINFTSRTHWNALIIEVVSKIGQTRTSFRRNANSINATLETNRHTFTENVRMSLVAAAANLDARQSRIGLSGLVVEWGREIIIAIYFNFNNDAG
jgi:hypothetical protein